MAISFINTQTFLAAIKNHLFSSNNEQPNTQTVLSSLKSLKAFDDAVEVPMYGALVGDTNFEAAWHDLHPFTYEAGNKFKIEGKIEIKGTDNADEEGNSIIGQLDYVDPNDPENILYTMVVYYFNSPKGHNIGLSLFAIKSREWFKQINIEAKEPIKDSILDFLIDVEIKNHNTLDYDVKVLVNGIEYEIRELELTQGAYAWVHYPATNRLGWKYYNPLKYLLYNFAFNINGVERKYEVTADYADKTLHDISGNNGPDIVFSGNGDNKVNTLEDKFVLLLDNAGQAIKTKLTNLLPQVEN